MKKLLITGAILLATMGQMIAAQKLDLKEITKGAFREQTIAAVNPMADGETYAQISADGKQIVQYSFKTGKQVAVLFDATKARGAKVNKVDGYVMSPKGNRMLIQTQTKNIYRRSFTAVYYIFNIANNKLEPLSDGGPQQTPVWSPDGEQVAFVRDNNIHLVKLLYNNAESQVTKDGKFNEVINGIPDWVNEEEFSFNSSMVFTADSKQIVWVRYDESQVKEYAMPMFHLDEESKGAYAYTYKYPKAGDDNAKVSLMSYDIKSHQTRTMQLPLDADGYIARIKATSDASKVLAFTLNRHQDCLSIYAVNPLSTTCKLIIEDKVDKYINENVFANLAITDKHLVLTSERDGYNHIYLYNLNGQLVRSIADFNQGVRLGEKGHSIVTDVYGYNEQTGDLYFAALNDGPADQKVYVSHKDGKVDCLTEKNGWNSAIFSADFKSFLCKWSDMNNPTVYSLCNNQGKTLTTLVDNKELKQKYDSYDMGEKEFFVFTTPETKLVGYMVKPNNFDPNKKYPVVMYQYGGPGSQQVKNAWGIGMSGQGAIMEQYLCQQGYICVCVDNRGTGGRGAEFEKCTYLRLGELEARDQVEAALWLGQQSYVDKDRIAIWGWSYGGWNTLMSMSEGRPVFRCGIAIAPPTCWRFYAEYVEALVQADKDFRQLVYTNRNHSIFGGNTRNHLFRQCVNFFNENLKQ